MSVVEPEVTVFMLGLDFGRHGRLRGKQVLGVGVRRCLYLSSEAAPQTSKWYPAV
jgi:hypothetical protein